MPPRRRSGPLRANLVRVIDSFFHGFPGLLTAATLAAFYAFVSRPTPARFGVLLALPYVVPLVGFRLLMLVSPLREGASVLAKGVWSPWFVSYRLQVIYAYFPFLEGALLSVPGLFNWWLRAWGSRVGRRVGFAAVVQITDRGHLVIGDDVLFGNLVYLSPHVVQQRRGRGVLYFKRITIGSRCFVGAGVRMGPGVIVDDDSMVPLLTDLYVKERFPKPTPAPAEGA